MFNEISHEALADKHGSELFDSDKWHEKQDLYDYMLIGGANLLRDNSFFWQSTKLSCRINSTLTRIRLL